MPSFRQSRDFLLAHRTDYEKAVAGFRWPESVPFNWAIDWFDAELAGPASRDRCGLWIVDYRASPTVPRAWATSGWRLWQYASDVYAGRRGRNRIIQGVNRFDRNLFNGDVAALYRFWNAAA